MSLAELAKEKARSAARLRGAVLQGVRRPPRPPGRRGGARGEEAGRQPRLSARARLPGDGRRTARRRDREALASGYRAAGRGAGGGALVSDWREEPLIFEKSQAGRCACSLPDYELPEGGAAGRPGPRRGAAPARAGRARPRPPLLGARRPQLRRRLRLLSARLLHDEVQPAPERAPGRPARLRRPAPAPAARGRAGRARALLPAAAGAGRDLRARRRLAPAGGRLAGRADRADAGARLLPGPGRARDAAQGGRARHGARHQPGQRHHGRLRAAAGQDRRARQPRPRGSAPRGRAGHRRR